MTQVKEPCSICGRLISKSNMSRHIHKHDRQEQIKIIFEISHPNGLFCKFCGKECKSKQGVLSHETQCKLNPDYTNNNFNQIQDNLFCQYCNKQCKSLNSLRQHECRCKENSNRITANMTYDNFSEYRKTHGSWNKGLTKETDVRVKNYGEKVSKSISKLLSGKPLSENHKKAISAGMKNANLSNNGRHSYGKAGYYDGIYLNSTYELAYYIYNVEHNVNIVRCKDSFKYIFENNQHIYTPDFYLTDVNLYIEIKGYETEKDRAKYKSVDNLQVLYYNDIKHMIEYVQNKYEIKDISILYDAA